MRELDTPASDNYNQRFGGTRRLYGNSEGKVLVSNGKLLKRAAKHQDLVPTDLSISIKETVCLYVFKSVTTPFEVIYIKFGMELPLAPGKAIGYVVGVIGGRVMGVSGRD